MQPVQPVNTTGSQLLQMPNGQLFMLPSNAYPVVQPVQNQLITLETVRLQGMSNEAFKEP